MNQNLAGMVVDRNGVQNVSFCEKTYLIYANLYEELYDHIDNWELFNQE